MNLSPLITAAELLNIYQNPEVMIFDVSSGPDIKRNYEAAHLEGAYFIDLNSQLADIKDDASQGGRHPLPDIRKFAETLGGLGITKDTHVVLYDDKNGSNAAARFWWMLKSAGHEKVQVLNGGLQEAVKQDFPVDGNPTPAKTPAAPYPAEEWKLPTIGLDEVEHVSQNPEYLVIDVRDKYRYDGISEPIDLVAGHIPGAVNVPFSENLDESGVFLNPNELRNKYDRLFRDISHENITVHCGSGVTACHTLLALAYAGMELPRLYVGSWSEWSRNDKTIATSS